jgi:hypothetical protein
LKNSEQRTRGKTILRTVRTNSEIDEILQKDSKSKKVTVNALIGSIFTKYAEWDRFTEKLRFVSASPLLFRELLSMLSDEEIVELASEMGQRQPIEWAKFWFKKLDVEAFIGLFSLFCTYGGYGEYELETDGREYTMIVHHDLGEKWSLYLENLIRATSEKAFGIKPQFRRTSDFVSMNVRIQS